jgi:hypothetical protein
LWVIGYDVDNCLDVRNFRTCGSDVDVEIAWKTDSGNNKLRLCVCL